DCQAIQAAACISTGKNVRASTIFWQRQWTDQMNAAIRVPLIAGCVMLSVQCATPRAHAGAERVCPAKRLADGNWNEIEVRECMNRINGTIKPHETGHWVWRNPPPPEFDKPYDGGVLAVHRAPLADIQKICGAISRGAHACNFTLGNRLGCLILLPPDEEIDRRLDPNDIIRHELGHCNGWPPDHPNRQARWEWVEK